MTTPIVRRGDVARASAISPRARIAISRTQLASLPLAARIVSGRPTSVLRLPAVRSTGPSGRRRRRNQLLGRGLAVRSGDADHPSRETRRARRAPDRRAPRRGSSTAITATPRSRRVRPARARPPRRPRPPGAACAGEVEPVDALAGKREEELSRSDLAAVVGRAGEGGAARARLHDRRLVSRAPRNRGFDGPGPLTSSRPWSPPHRAPPSAAAASSRSSKWVLVVPTIW